MPEQTLREVAVFDADLPTGLACIRSLGRAGVPVTAYSHDPAAMGGKSKFATEFRSCPSIHDTDAFVEWLATELADGRIDLVAPTSDFIMFNTAEALERVAPDAAIDIAHPSSSALLDCLLKNRFADALHRVGFPTPRSCAPSSARDALTFSELVGFPLVVKPRTHVGVGVARGDILHTEAELEALFEPFEVGPGHSAATRHDEHLGWPLLQEYIDRPDVEVVSVTGCIGVNGELLAVHHSVKQRQWPPGLGIGTHFTSLGRQVFTDHAVEAVRAILGHGIFELEVIIDRTSGDYWAIDLNPRAFGQVTLDIANGNDLPALWYQSVTGHRSTASAHQRRFRHRGAVHSWHFGIPLAVDFAVGILRGPQRRQFLCSAWSALTESRVGAAFDTGDLRPSLSFVRRSLRHPGGLVRPFLRRPTS